MLFWHKVVGVAIFVSFIGCLILVRLLLVVPSTSSNLNEDKPTNDWFGSSESFIIPAGEYITREREFSKGTMLKISFDVIGDGSKAIELLVVDESDYWRWRDGQSVQSPFPWGGPAVSGNITFMIPNDANWFFVWDNSFDLTDEKEVTAEVTYNYGR